MQAWRVHRHGAPSAALQLDEIEEPQPGPGQIRVRVRATALNFNEIDGCYGRYQTIHPPLPYTLGMEVLGEVDAAGAGAEGWLGRRVTACPPGAIGGHAQWALAGTDMAFDAPAALDDREAAAFYFPFHLAYLGLHERGALRAGETLLVHAAAGGVGSAALQLGVAAGARVIATAGGPEKAALCRELGADLAIDYRSDDFKEAVLDATQGEGADLVFDGVGGEVRERSLQCIARGGRLLMIGFASGIEAEDEGLTPRPVLFGNCSLLGVMLAYTHDAPAVKRASGFNLFPREVGERVQAALEALLDAKRIRPVIGRSVPHTQLPEALDAMEARETFGRVVVEW